MAMETNATNLTNVSSVQPTKPVSNEPVERKIGDSASGSKFQPQTNVNIKSAVKDITELLSKVSSTETMTENTLPQELQKLVQNMMKNTFSLENTLAQGMGSSMESQRFSLEQLTTLARMLTQLGAVAEQGKASALPETLQTLLSNLKNLDGADGKLLDTVNLNKLAFGLLDKKTVESLPVELQLLLGNFNGQQTAALPTQKSETFAFLKQLVDYFMPAANAKEASLGSNTEQKQPSNASTSPETAASTTAKSADTIANGKNAEQTRQNAQMQGNSEAASQNAGAKNAAATNTASKSDGNETMLFKDGKIPTNASSQGTMELPENGDVKTNTPSLPGQDTAFQQKKDGEISLPAQNQKMQQDGAFGQVNKQQTGETTQNTANASTSQVTGQEMTDSAKSQQQQQQMANPAQQAAAKSNTSPNNPMTAPSGNLQNTEQTMDTLKSLATLLLKDQTMSEQDTTLLKAFVNGKQQLLSEPEAKQLQLLIRLSEKNIPASIQQAAQKENLPNLPKLWSFVQLCDLAEVKDMQAQQLKSAGKSISDFATVLRQSMPNENTTVENQRSLSFMMPLYMGENEKSYPTYVHVYDEKKKNNETGIEAKETWLRLCLLTENIGAVEMVFRLYEQQNLNIRLSFSDDAAVKSFTDYIPEVKASMEDASLVLTDLKVSAIGSKIL